MKANDIDALATHRTLIDIVAQPYALQIQSTKDIAIAICFTQKRLYKIMKTDYNIAVVIINHCSLPL